MHISLRPGTPHSSNNIKQELGMLLSSKYTKKGQQRQWRLISLQVLNTSRVNDKTYNNQTHLIFSFSLSSLLKYNVFHLLL